MRITEIAFHAGLAIFVVGIHVACGGGGNNNNQSAPPATPSTPLATEPQTTTTSSPSNNRHEHEHEVATGNTLTGFQKRRLLGHYSTGDGASGFILDRTVSPWKAKLDGVPKVVVMFESNRPRAGVTEYQSDDRSIWLRVDEEGSVELFQGPKQHEGVRVARDADADQLK